jgi:hypothetical protein
MHDDITRFRALVDEAVSEMRIADPRERRVLLVLRSLVEGFEVLGRLMAPKELEPDAKIAMNDDPHFRALVMTIVHAMIDPETKRLRFSPVELRLACTAALVHVFERQSRPMMLRNIDRIGEDPDRG